MISKSHGWRKTAVASLVVALFGLPASSAFALALGRITVLSALGEPLRAEIDVPQITADEAASFRSVIALPEAFRAAGLEFNPALTGLQISLQRRADGSSFIRLATDRVVSEPFVDLILETSWASGKIVRDYTVLLDPPALRSRAPIAPATPQVVASAVASARVDTTPAPAAAAVSAAATTRASPAAAPAKPQSRAKQITVQRGDTASAIARDNKPSQVSLDQMLVALLRANADAFINGNLNLLKAGAVLTLPTDEQAASVSDAEASRTVIAQSKDFNAFRAKLASNAPTQPVAAASRSASGALQTQVEDKKTSAQAPDKLTLSKGAADAKAAADKIALEKAAQDAAQRTAELTRNVKDLTSIGAASTTAGTAVPPVTAAAAPAKATAPVTITAPAPVVAPPAPVVTAPPAPVAVPPAPTPAPPVPPATTAAPAPPAPSAAPTPPAPKPAPPAPEEPGLLDQLLASPLTLLGGGLLIALLAGLGIYKARQRRDAAEVDSAFLESRLQPDSFFGASGGQRVDTNDGAATGSSMVYSPSQLDAADDVDPVAEADVYLAYGRDLQAEEILKEALRTHAGRIAVHMKLLEIYAKRRDTQAFEGMAKEAFRLAGGEGPEWARICEQGSTIDPANPLYQPGSNPAAVATVSALATSPMPIMAADGLATQKLDRTVARDAQNSKPVDLDLDLDFSLDEEPITSAIIAAQPGQLERTVAIDTPVSLPGTLDVDFGEITKSMQASPESAAAPLPVEVSLPDIESAEDTLALDSVETDQFRQQAAVSFGSTSPARLSDSDPDATQAAMAQAPKSNINFNLTAPSVLTASQTPFKAQDAPDSGMLEFDLGTLSLDLDAGDATGQDSSGESEDPLATKLALAEEFVSIGDDDGARALIEEVIAEASGELKAKAQRALGSLG